MCLLRSQGASLLTFSKSGLRRRLGSFREYVRVRKDIVRSGFEFRGTAVKRLPAHFPNSYNYWSYPDLTYQSANALPGQIDALCAVLLPNDRPLMSLELEPVDETVATSLAECFDRYGSDKGKHGYHRVYAGLLTDIAATRAEPRILEIGIGTNNPSLVSTMGVHGSPGASLRAFRYWCPGALVFGADVDQEILFAEAGIQTAFVDQLSPQTFLEMGTKLGCGEFDLVIDDGLHNPEANLNTLLWAITTVRPGGFIVIEDIPDRAATVWRLVSTILTQAGFASDLFSGCTSRLFVVKVPDDRPD